MFVISPLIDLACRIGGPRFAHRVRVARAARWRNFEEEFDLLDHLVDPDAAAVDVGANEGIYAGRLAQLCSSVHCFEPIPSLARDLRRKLPSSVKVHEVALSDRAGRGQLRIPYSRDTQLHGLSSLEAGNPMPGANRIEVIECRLATLDEVVSERVGFIKVDVEGHELAVLRGARRLIERDRPTLLVESENRHQADAPQNVFDLMAEMGYGGFYLDRGKLHALSAFDLHAHQDVANFDRKTRSSCSDYVNNFIFVPGQKVA